MVYHMSLGHFTVLLTTILVYGFSCNEVHLQTLLNSQKHYIGFVGILLCILQSARGQSAGTHRGRPTVPLVTHQRESLCHHWSPWQPGQGVPHGPSPGTRSQSLLVIILMKLPLSLPCGKKDLSRNTGQLPYAEDYVGVVFGIWDAGNAVNSPWWT